MFTILVDDTKNISKGLYQFDSKQHCLRFSITLHLFQFLEFTDLLILAILVDMWEHLNLVLIGIFLIIDKQYWIFFSYIYWPCKIRLFCEMLTQIFCPYPVGFSSFLNIGWLLYIFWIRALCQFCMCWISPPALWFMFWLS